MWEMAGHQRSGFNYLSEHLHLLIFGLLTLQKRGGGWFDSIMVYKLWLCYSNCIRVCNSRKNQLNNILFIYNYISVAVIHFISVREIQQSFVLCCTIPFNILLRLVKHHLMLRRWRTNNVVQFLESLCEYNHTIHTQYKHNTKHSDSTYLQYVLLLLALGDNKSQWLQLLYYCCIIELGTSHP